MNIILLTDSYKLGHFKGYPKGLQFITSYAEARGGRYPQILVAGVNRFIDWLGKVRVTMQNIAEAEEFAFARGDVFFPRADWETIVHRHGGRIPVVIDSIPEGTLVPVQQVIARITNIDPSMHWLVSHIETAFLQAIWYPTTVATRCFYMKQAIKPYFEETSDSLEGLDYAVHDFSVRGTTSMESAIIGGMAHHLVFKGSDNLPAAIWIRDFYGDPVPSVSIPATEHSIMTSWLDEMESFEYLVDNMLPEGGALSVVSDSYDIYTAVERWCSLADKIRAKNGTLVVRPDSGDIVEVLNVILPRLMEAFGYTVNQKGYKVLNNVKVIWGDGIDEYSCVVPFAVAESLGISADSIVVGSGGGLMQSNIDRDTCKFAFKGCLAEFADGTERPIGKNPITDTGKASKRGYPILVEENGQLTTKVYRSKKIAAADIANGDIVDLLETVYPFQVWDTLEGLRAKVNAQL